MTDNADIREREPWRFLRRRTEADDRPMARRIATELTASWRGQGKIRFKLLRERAYVRVPTTPGRVKVKVDFIDTPPQVPYDVMKGNVCYKTFLRSEREAAIAWAIDALLEGHRVFRGIAGRGLQDGDYSDDIMN
jgi:hypothetical protein